MTKMIYAQGSDGDTLMMSLAGDTEDDDDDDDVDDDGDSEYGSDLGPYHRLGPQPTATQWAAHVEVDRTSRTAHEEDVITVESC
jgi:hypothetical protein